MSRKDYVLIAYAIKAEVDSWGAMTTDEERRMAKAIAERIASELKKDNPMFKHDMFMCACGF